MCVSKAYTFCKQTKEDDGGYRTAASKYLLKLPFLSPSPTPHYEAKNNLAAYLILGIVFL